MAQLDKSQWTAEQWRAEADKWKAHSRTWEQRSKEKDNLLTETRKNMKYGKIVFVASKTMLNAWTYEQLMDNLRDLARDENAELTGDIDFQVVNSFEELNTGPVGMKGQSISEAQTAEGEWVRIVIGIMKPSWGAVTPKTA